MTIDREDIAGSFPLLRIPRFNFRAPVAEMAPALRRRYLSVQRAKDYEGHSKDYEFSRLSMEEHWRAGYHDTRRQMGQNPRGALRGTG